MTGPGRAVGASMLAVVVALVACAPIARPGSRSAGSAQPIITPEASLSAQVRASAEVVRAALSGAGYRLDDVRTPVRPAEPASFATVPRAVLQVDTGDANQGYLVIYDLPDVTSAATHGRELAEYVGSGFGQTNYPSDAQFSVSQLGATLLFTWWSREGSSDAARAERAFETVRAVGVPLSVPK